MARNKVHPIKKLQDQLAQIESTMANIINAAGDPDFVEGIKALKVETKGAATEKMSGGVAEISKLLQQYPGLTKDTLRYLKAEVNKFKKFGMLEELKKPTQKLDQKPKEK